MDITALQQLTDEFMNFKIAQTPGLSEAQAILERIQRRDLYKCIEEIPITNCEEVKRMGTAAILEDIGANYPGDKADFTIVRQKVVPGMRPERVREKNRQLNKNDFGTLLEHFI